VVAGGSGSGSPSGDRGCCGRVSGRSGPGCRRASPTQGTLPRAHYPSATPRDPSGPRTRPAHARPHPYARRSSLPRPSVARRGPTTGARPGLAPAPSRPGATRTLPLRPRPLLLSQVPLLRLLLHRRHPRPPGAVRGSSGVRAGSARPVEPRGAAPDGVRRRRDPQPAHPAPLAPGAQRPDPTLRPVPDPGRRVHRRVQPGDGHARAHGHAGRGRRQPRQLRGPVLQPGPPQDVGALARPRERAPGLGPGGGRRDPPPIPRPDLRHPGADPRRLGRRFAHGPGPAPRARLLLCAHLRAQHRDDRAVGAGRVCARARGPRSRHVRAHARHPARRGARPLRGEQLRPPGPGVAPQSGILASGGLARRGPRRRRARARLASTTTSGPASGVSRRSWTSRRPSRAATSSSAS